MSGDSEGFGPRYSARALTHRPSDPERLGAEARRLAAECGLRPGDLALILGATTQQVAEWLGPSAEAGGY